MAVWVIVNVEEWDPTADDAAHGAHAARRRLADARRAQLGLARVRQPRRLLALHQSVRRVCDIPGSLAINGSALAAYHADRARRDRAASWEFMGHGFTQRNMQKVRGRARRHPQDARRHRSRRPASRRAAGSAPVSPKPGRRRTCWSRKATTMLPTGCSTISRCGSRPAPGRSSTCPIRRNATTSP